jgi:hypothetical protein
MKTIANVLAMLAFVATAQAEDVNKSDAASTKIAPTEPATAAAPAPAPIHGTVARAAITNGVENHEPVDNLADVTTKTEKVYYFTELRDMEGQTVKHRWEHNGEMMAEVPFQVGGSRWRVFSSKKLAPTSTGEWTVAVVDGAGNTVRADTFMYTQTPTASATSSETPKDTMTGATADTKAKAPTSQ